MNFFLLFFKMASFLENGDIDNKVLEAMWTRFTNVSSKYNMNERRAAIALLGMTAVYASLNSSIVPNAGKKYTNILLLVPHLNTLYCLLISQYLYYLQK